MNLERGDVYFADMAGPSIGSEQGGTRPVVILQNNIGNRHSPTTIIATITSQFSKPFLPTHVYLEGAEVGLSKNSIVLLEQIKTIDKQRLQKFIGKISFIKMKEIEKAIKISLGI